MPHDRADTAPRTEAGRALLADVPNYMDGRSYRDRVMLPAILAIEREAAALDAPAPLDLERLRIAYEAGRAAASFESALDRANEVMDADTSSIAAEFSRLPSEEER